jgi:hypothetical protein
MKVGGRRATALGNGHTSFWFDCYILADNHRFQAVIQFGWLELSKDDKLQGPYGTSYDYELDSRERDPTYIGGFHETSTGDLFLIFAPITWKLKDAETEYFSLQETGTTQVGV